MADQFLQDGQVDFVAGQDASQIPVRIAENSYAAGINLQVSKGVPGPRWGSFKKEITFPEGGITNPVSHLTVSYSEIFHSGRFQSLIPYAFGGQTYLLVIISGVIFLINKATFVAAIIPIQGGGSLNQTTPRLNWSNAGKYLVIFDYPNYPVIFDGVTARRSDPAKYEVPISTIGMFNQNRLFIGNAGNEYTAGDPVGNLATPEAPITFEEVLAPAATYSAQVFQLPTNYLNNSNDPITAMTYLQQTDTSTGIGPALIATGNQIFSIQSQRQRAQWQPLGQPTDFASLFVANAGIAGPRAVTNVNTDVFFLSNDGQLRSAAMSRDEQRKWSRVPISREVSNWLKYWDKSLIPYTVLGYFKNKIFVTANPYRVVSYDTNRNPIYDIAFGGMVVLSTDNLATLGHDGVPAWDGLWIPCRPMDMCEVSGNFFIISKDDYSRNEIYELRPNTTFDMDSKGRVRQVTSTLYTREFDFKTPFQDKDLYSLVLGIQNVSGDFSCNVEFKPSHGTNYVEWQTFEHLAPWRNCGVPEDCLVNGLAPHNFKNITFGTPLAAGACDLVSQLKYGNIRKVQLKFTISGIYWELQEYLLNTKPTPQAQRINNVCDNLKVGPAICVECNNSDWAIGPFESCQFLQT